VNAAAFGADDDLVLTFAVDETFAPVLVGRGVDRRELGFRVHHVFLEPRQSSTESGPPAGGAP